MLRLMYMRPYDDGDFSIVIQLTRGRGHLFNLQQSQRMGPTLSEVPKLVKTFRPGPKLDYSSGLSISMISQIKVVASSGDVNPPSILVVLVATDSPLVCVRATDYSRPVFCATLNSEELVTRGLGNRLDDLIFFTIWFADGPLLVNVH